MALKTLVLASGSPRRKQLLERAGLSFRVVESRYQEDLSLDLRPHELARALSRGKAKEVARRVTNAVVIAADTILVLDQKILGKPRSREEAAIMLGELSGRVHSVITGFTVMDSDTGKEVSESVETRVWFKSLTEDDIRSYVNTGEPLDKAGAYAIQGKGASLVETIEGDYHNVVGLPLNAVLQVLKGFGEKELL